MCAAIKYRYSQQQFSSAQRAQRKFRVEPGRSFGKICQIVTICYVPSLSGSCQTNQLRSLSLLLGTLSHGAHEPISIVLWTRFLDAHAYGSGHLFAKIAIPCTIYPSLNLLAFLSISVVLQTRVLDARIKNICACSVSLEICQL